MAIALVGTPTAQAGSSVTAATLTITVPTGSTGDLLLIGVSSASQATASSTAPLITASSANTVKIGFIPGILVSMALFYRVVQAGDPTSYTFTVNAGSPYGAVCARYSGVDTTTLFRQWNIVGELKGGGVTATSTTFPIADNVQSSDLAVAFAAMGTSTKTTSQTTALSTPASWTNVIASFGATSGITSSYHTAMALYSRTAGSDAPSVTGATGQYAAIRVVLVPADTPVRDAPGGTISFVNASTATTVAAATSSLAVNAPSGIADGDLLLLAAGSSAGFSAFAPPAGWLSLGVGAGRYSMGTTSFVSDLVEQVWYKFASSEPASYTVSYTDSAGIQEVVLVVVAYRGVRNPYPIELAAVTNSTAAAATTSVASYALPQVNADNLVVNFYGAGGDTTGTFTMTGPSSPWNQRAQIISAVASDFNAAITVVDKLAAGDQPTSTVSKASTFVTVSVSLVGIPGISNVFARRFGPNYRR